MENRKLINHIKHKILKAIPQDDGIMQSRLYRRLNAYRYKTAYSQAIDELRKEDVIVSGWFENGYGERKTSFTAVCLKNNPMASLLLR